ncbi:hypothetical protein BegalDRAFT_3571 [Beggiatoa alba B18LD]|uniref:Uncharacterized protein n=1 Tax=Beggiatoa alba B18LD TaxID=395493 RepID=I3CBE4_9GAMM|nr:hypothetical protein [Beggiatoa alba]EIJ40937.1 hypothetical protein BegalDRAFT_3571 [Beggiatoa alba B18LD]
MSTKAIDIFRVSTRNAEIAESFKQRIENAKKLAGVKVGANISSDSELLDFLLSSLEKENDTEKLSRNEQNTLRIQELVKKQMDLNATDNATVLLGNKTVFVNKRYISSAWIQKELGCSYVAIKSWFDNPENQTMLDKHHVKHGIDANHNRLIAKIEKNMSLGKGA